MRFRFSRLFGPMFIAAGVNHFVNPMIYEKIMPDYLPAHRELVLASGAAEIVGGAATMFKKTRRFGSLFSIATLVGVFPANLHMATHPERYPQIPGSRRTLLFRLPLQLAFLVWAWQAGEPRLPQKQRYS